MRHRPLHLPVETKQRHFHFTKSEFLNIKVYARYTDNIKEVNSEVNIIFINMLLFY